MYTQLIRPNITKSHYNLHYFKEVVMEVTRLLLLGLSILSIVFSELKKVISKASSVSCDSNYYT